MTNESSTGGKHRTAAPWGTVEGTSAHRRGTVDRSAGVIQRETWAHQAVGTRLDLEHDRALRVLGLSAVRPRRGA
jgi:hypothetical protein